jgi:hypothetical protein
MESNLNCGTGDPMDSIMVKVKSSNIAEIGYVVEPGTLYVKFTSGALYTYRPFSQAKFDEFKKAKSKGEWFAAHVRNNKKYTVHKI